MLTRSTSLPIDGWIGPSREFLDKTLQEEYQKCKRLATLRNRSIVCFISAHNGDGRPGCAPWRNWQYAGPRMVPRKEYPSTIISAKPLSNSAPATMRGGRSGAYTSVSFAIEPIQPPIVPLSLFSPQPLRTTAGA